MADINVQRALNVSMGWTRPTLAIYPALDPAAPWGVFVVGGAGVWGGWADIIGNTAPAIATEFWLQKLIIGAIGPGGGGLYAVQIQNTTTGVLVYECRADITAVTANLIPFGIPVPWWCAPNDNIQARKADAAGTRISVSLLVATGL